MSGEAVTETRQRFRWWLEIPTRWMDNDVYGHVNNVQYYSYFDTAVNTHLIRDAGLDIHNSPWPVECHLCDRVVPRRRR